MTVAVVNYMQFKARASLEAVSPIWQNFFVDRPADFLPFGYGQGSGRVAGDRSEATLAVPVNQISLNFAHEAMTNRYVAEVETREINISSMQEVRSISREIWTIGSYSHDQEILTLRLRGPGNAVSTGPVRFISESLVGSIPASGSLVIG